MDSILWLFIIFAVLYFILAVFKTYAYSIVQVGPCFICRSCIDCTFTFSWTHHVFQFRLIQWILRKMSLSDETTGMIKGLAEVVKHQQLQNTAIQHTTEQLAQLSSTVADLAHNLTTMAPPSLTLPQGLRLPNLVLPHCTGKENLDRFIEQLETILKSSGVPSKFWVTYLKQQTQKDPRAYDVICAADRISGNFGHSIGKKECLPSEFQQHYEAKRGKPRDHQLRELLGTYYTMCQQAN